MQRISLERCLPQSPSSPTWRAGKVGGGLEETVISKASVSSGWKSSHAVCHPHPGSRWRQQRLGQARLFCIFKKFTNSLAAMSAEARLLTRSPGNDSNTVSFAAKPGIPCGQETAIPYPSAFLPPMQMYHRSPRQTESIRDIL